MQPHKFHLLVLLLSITQLAQCYENYTFSLTGSRCFPVYVKRNEEAQLDLSLLEYEPLPGLSAEENQTNVAALVYRHQELNHEKVFIGDYNIHTICDGDAIKRGYCEEKHKGKILFEYKDDGGYQGNAFSEIFHEIKSYHDVHHFKESGFYCVYIVAHRAKKFKLEVLIKDGYNLNLMERRHINLLLFKVIGVTALGGVFFYKWFKWSKVYQSNIPYLVKILIADMVLQVSSNIAGAAETSLGSNASNSFLSKLLSYVWRCGLDFDDVALVFYLYQYSGCFTYDKFEFEHIKVFGLLLLVEIVPNFLETYDKIFNSENLNQLLNIAFTIVFLLVILFYLVVKIRTCLRYYRTSKEFNDFQKGDDPKLKQFKWLILSRLIMGTFFVFVYHILGGLLGSLIRLIPLYKQLFLLDGKINPYSFYEEAIPRELIVLSVQFYVLFKFWTPKYFKKAENFTKSLE